MTIAVLSWGAHKTLENTLKSYEKYDLPAYDTERVIFFQQISDEDIKIAERFGYQYIGAETNIGIAEGYKRLVEFATGQFFLFLENDWELIAQPAPSLSDARSLIITNDVDIVKLRHRWTPGNPLWTRQFDGKEWERPTHLLDCVHWNLTPDIFFPEITRVTVYKRSWYTASSKNANWSNNPHIAKTQWVRDTILPRLGNRDIEVDLQSWWEKQDYRVGQGDGLFTHNRLN